MLLLLMPNPVLFISFAVAGVTGAVGSTLAAILRPLSHLKSLKSPLGWSHPKDHGLTGGDLLLSQARVHVAPVAAAATLAVGATSAVSTTARHFSGTSQRKGMRRISEGTRVLSL